MVDCAAVRVFCAHLASEDTTMVDTTALDAAIAKHAQWKHYLRQAVKTGQSEWTVASIAHDK